jgi:hypothetical protein
MGWATFWAIFSQNRLAALVGTARHIGNLHFEFLKENKHFEAGRRSTSFSA